MNRAPSVTTSIHRSGDAAATALAAAVAAAEFRFAQANPRSRERHERASVPLPGGNTRTVLHHAPFPLAFSGGHGATLTSLDGRDYVDLLGEYTAGLFGHSHPRILQTIHATLDRGISLGGSNEAEVRLAELICARFRLDSVRFTNSGTEANLMALAAAIAFTGRRGVLVFEGGYHGGVLSFAHGDSPVNVPHRWVIGRYNDAAGARELIRAHAADLAAVLVEFMQGAGGCVAADPEFLRTLREESAAAGALLVADEVMTSRLGPHGLQHRVGIDPDLTTLGKYLGGGMSFGAFGGRADVLAQFDPTRSDSLEHAGTFNNNVLTMNAGVVAIGEVLDDTALAALNARGDVLRERLNARARQADVDVRVTGIGSLLTVHVGATRGPAYCAQAQHLFFLDMVERGYWIAARGMLALNLEVTDSDCAGFADAFTEFVAARRSLLD